MNDDKHMALVVLFEDLTTEKVNVDSLDEARYKAAFFIIWLSSPCKR